MNDIPAQSLTGFSNMLATLAAAGDDFTIALPADWLQGRTAYGGLSAALCLQAALRAFPEVPPLRSAQVAFIGPAVGELKISPRMLPCPPHLRERHAPTSSIGAKGQTSWRTSTAAWPGAACR